MDELRRLRTEGAISDATLIVEEGGAHWREFGEYRAPEAASSVRTASPPMSPDAVSEAHDRITVEAVHRAHALEVSATLAKDSALATFRSAQTIGEKGVLFGASGAFLAFFLPWVSAFGNSISGLSLANRASAILYLLPLSMVLTCFLSYFNIKADRRDRILRARWFTVIGTFWCGVSVIGIIAGQRFLGVASVGLYATFIATTAVAAGGARQIGEQMSKPRD
jgi:hypothetical protein